MYSCVNLSRLLYGIGRKKHCLIIKSFILFFIFSVFEHMTSVPLQIKGKITNVLAGFSYYSVTTDQNEVCIWGNGFSGSVNYGKMLFFNQLLFTSYYNITLYACKIFDF